MLREHTATHGHLTRADCPKCALSAPPINDIAGHAQSEKGAGQQQRPDEAGTQPLLHLGCQLVGPADEATDVCVDPARRGLGHDLTNQVPVGVAIPGEQHPWRVIAAVPVTRGFDRSLATDWADGTGSTKTTTHPAVAMVRSVSWSWGAVAVTIGDTANAKR